MDSYMQFIMPTPPRNIALTGICNGPERVTVDKDRIVNSIIANMNQLGLPIWRTVTIDDDGSALEIPCTFFSPAPAAFSYWD